jgi:hypothetical protein
MGCFLEGEVGRPYFQREKDFVPLIAGPVSVIFGHGSNQVV